MERRVLIAIFLSFIVLYGYQAFVPTQPEPPKPLDTQTTSATSTQRGTAVPVTATPAPGAPAPIEAGAPSAAPLVGDTVERDIRVETSTVVAIVTNRGARLKSWRLKHYRDAAGNPVELVVTELATTHPLPFSLRTEDSAVARTLNSALWSVSPSAADHGGSITAETTISFEYRDTAGLQAQKVLTFQPGSYVVGFRASVRQGDRDLPTVVEWGPALGDGDAGTGRTAVVARGLVAVADNVERLAAASIPEKPTFEGNFQYAGVDDHYFMTAAIAPGPSTITFQPASIPAPAGSEAPAEPLMAYAIDPGNDDVNFYVGPKDFDQLVMVDRSMVRAIDFGIFAVIVVPLLRSLKWINGFIGNYGWSIIILTILINAIMFPLRHKSVVSMRKMQEIQPEAKAIQERYAKLKATDPAKQKMNQELMGLYKERGVNPASGCIPMLLTMPVLFAFYSLLSTAIELRGAPFFAWIHDLSAPDPFYVTPLLMGASQFWQTKMTPQTGVDPAQQKMMMFMPIIFTGFSLWFPSGVALYWLVSNVWGIGQTYLTNYLIGPPNVRTVRPAAERRVKRVGSGKTEAGSANPKTEKS